MSISFSSATSAYSLPSTSSTQKPSKSGVTTSGATTTKPASSDSAVQAFLDYQRLTPEQKIRKAILEKLHLTEEALKNLPPKERLKIEADIKNEIEKQMKQSLAQKGLLVDISV